MGDSNHIEKKKIRRIIFVAVSFLCAVIFTITLILLPSGGYDFFQFIRFISWVLIGLSSCFLLVFSVLKVKEYVSYYQNLRDETYHPHRLTYSQVLKNQSRLAIIENVLEEPNIQYTKLRKMCNLQPGPFRWHVKVLLNYGIIKKQKIGQNVVFRPANSKIIQEIDQILKFPLREKIYKVIQNQPGMSISGVARSLNMPNQRNKIKYHVDKLIQASLITSVRNGRISELNPIS